MTHLISRGVIPHEAEPVAHFLRTTKGLSKRRSAPGSNPQATLRLPSGHPQANPKANSKANPKANPKTNPKFKPNPKSKPKPKPAP